MAAFSLPYGRVFMPRSAFRAPEPSGDPIAFEVNGDTLQLAIDRFTCHAMTVLDTLEAFPVRTERDLLVTYGLHSGRVSFTERTPFFVGQTSNLLKYFDKRSIQNSRF